jgi:predicted AlkP superfamily phosphohydrolase/phosphomutase
VASTVACSTPTKHDPVDAPPGHVLLIGLDGATWELIHPMILRGELANLERLRQEGAWGILRSDEPMASPRLWTTIATGRTPEDHGITGFYKVKPDGTQTTQTNLDRRAPALWNILSERKRRSTVVGWFYTWPVDRILGDFISDRSEGPMRGGQYPPELESLLSAVADRVSPQRARTDAERILGPSLASAGLPPSVLREARGVEEVVEEYLRIDRLRLEWTLELMDEHPSDLTAVFFKGIDALAHLLWIHMDPDSFDVGLLPPEPVLRRFEPTLLRYHEFLDEAIGELIRHAPPRTDVVIVSDHGFGPEPEPTVTLAYDLHPLLEALGWVVTDEDGHTDARRSAVVDPTPHWQKTQRRRALWINPRALDGHGNGDPMSGIEKVVRRLREVDTVGGPPLFDEVGIDRDSPCGPDGCRISVRIGEHAVRRGERAAGLAVTGDYRVGREERPLSQIAAVRVEFTGSHREEGVLLMAGPRVRRDVEISGADIYDVAPTVLRLLGLPRSRAMPGRVLESALRSDLVGPPPGPIATYERNTPIVRIDADPDLEEERRVQDRLKTLGYVN